jgi:hypothetical protein
MYTTRTILQKISKIFYESGRERIRVTGLRGGVYINILQLGEVV